MKLFFPLIPSLFFVNFVFAGINEDLADVTRFYWKDGSLQKAESLLNSGADPNYEGENGAPLLYYTSFEHAKLLVKFGANVNTRSVTGETPLGHLASDHFRRNIEHIKFLISNNAEVTNIDAKGNNLLHIAAGLYCEENNTYCFDLVTMCLNDLHLDINAINNRGETPLTLAILNKPPQNVIKLLVSHPLLNLNTRDCEGNSFLHLLAKKAPYGRSDRHSLFFPALLQSINVQNNRGETPLHIATNFLSSTELSSLLLANNADVNLLDKEGKSPLLNYASNSINSKEDIAVVEQMILSVKDINYANKSGRSILFFLSGQGEGRFSLLKFLLQNRNDLDVNIRDNDGLSPQVFALYEGNLKSFKLLQKKSEINLDPIFLKNFEDAHTKEIVTIAKERFSLIYPRTAQDRKRCIYHSLLAIQYSRWRQSSRTLELNKKYWDTLNYLIRNFGETNFVQACKEYFDFELVNLDTKNLTEEGPHTDFENPYSHTTMSLLKMVIKNRFPLARSMQDSGHLVNLRTLFGDEIFWAFVQTHYRHLYEELIVAIKNWPAKIESLAFNSPRRVYPLKIFSKHFPQAFTAISINL